MSEILCSAVINGEVVTLDIGVTKRGDPVYRISWYRNGKWVRARYTTFDAAHATWKMLTQVI